MLMLNRAFFSLAVELDPDADRARQPLPERDPRLPARKWLGVWGIPLATAICNIAGTAALLVVLRRRIGRARRRTRSRRRSIRVSVASAVVGAVSWTVWRPLDSELGRSFPAQVVSLGLALTAAVAVYLGSCRLLQVREMDTLLSLRSRLRRA